MNVFSAGSDDGVDDRVSCMAVGPSLLYGYGLYGLRENVVFVAVKLLLLNIGGFPSCTGCGRDWVTALATHG